MLIFPTKEKNPLIQNQLRHKKFDKFDSLQLTRENLTSISTILYYYSSISVQIGVKGNTRWKFLEKRNSPLNMASAC